jgi:hypothetical protein
MVILTPLYVYGSSYEGGEDEKFHPIDIDIIHVVRKNRHNNVARSLNNYERGDHISNI